MPRPRPPEELIPRTYRFTRRQIAKIESMGGAEWLRGLISKVQTSKLGRDPIDYARWLRARNETIAADQRSGTVVGAEYHLSRQQVNAIRRQYRKT